MASGNQFVVESTPDGVLLEQAALFPATWQQDVFGCLRTKGKAKTLAEMDAGIIAEVRRRHAR